jgi:hypothetical protein
LYGSRCARRILRVAGENPGVQETWINGGLNPANPPKADVYVYSGASDDQICSVLLEPESDIRALAGKLVERFGREAEIASSLKVRKPYIILKPEKQKNAHRVT